MELRALTDASDSTAAVRPNVVDGVTFVIVVPFTNPAPRASLRPARPAYGRRATALLHVKRSGRRDCLSNSNHQHSRLSSLWTHYPKRQALQNYNVKSQLRYDFWRVSASKTEIGQQHCPISPVLCQKAERLARGENEINGVRLPQFRISRKKISFKDIIYHLDCVVHPADGAAAAW